MSGATIVLHKALHHRWKKLNEREAREKERLLYKGQINMYMNQTQLSASSSRIHSDQDPSIRVLVIRALGSDPLERISKQTMAGRPTFRSGRVYLLLILFVKVVADSR